MNTKFFAEGILTPLSSKAQISYSFNIDKDCSCLYIDFTYRPKFLKSLEKSKELIINCLNKFEDENAEQKVQDWKKYRPICNLLTVTIDDSMGFRGCAHRHTPNQRLFICSDSASPGFIPGDIAKGIWKATISVHGVITEKCHYSLCIWEGCKKNDEMDSR